jgi:hypothetical protein
MISKLEFDLISSLNIFVEHCFVACSVIDYFVVTRRSQYLLTRHVSGLASSLLTHRVNSSLCNYSLLGVSNLNFSLTCSS